MQQPEISIHPLIGRLPFTTTDLSAYTGTLILSTSIPARSTPLHLFIALSSLKKSHCHSMHKIPLYFSFALAPKYKRILSLVISSIFFMQAPAHTYPAQKRSPHPCHNIYIRQDGRRISPSVPSLQAPYTVRKALRSSHH